MKKYIQYIVIIYGILYLLNPVQVLSQTPHLVYGNLEYSDQTIPQNITCEAYISSRSYEKLTENSPGCDYYSDSGTWVIQCSSFPSAWDADEVLVINFYDDEGGSGTDEVILSYNPSDDGGLTIMKRPTFQVTIESDPSGFKFYADSIEHTTPYTFNWELYSVHNISLDSLQHLENNTGGYFTHWNNGEKKDFEYQVKKVDTTITAFFNEIFYLQIETDHGNPQGEGWYYKHENAIISIQSREVKQNTRYLFNHWSGDQYSTDTSLIVNMDSPKYFTANWDTEYYLTVNSDHGNPQGQGWHNKNSQAGFSVATPDVTGNTKYIFTNWTGDYTGQESNTSILMDTSKTVTARWNTQYYLTMQKNPDQGGSTSPPPPGTWVDKNQQIELSATPATDYIFSEWAGDIGVSKNPTTLKMTNPVNVTANFLKIVNVTIKTNPSQQIIVVDGTEYTAPQTFEWIEKTVHSISVKSPVYTVKDTRYVFDSWSNGGAKIQNYTVSNEDEILTCSLKKQYHLTVDSEHGYPEGTGWYDAYTSANFSVTDPDLQGGTRYIFTKWSGDYSSTSPSGSIVMSSPKTVHASWEIQHFLTVRNAGHGEVTGEGWYDEGQTALFSVTQTTVMEGSSTRYVFSSWEGKGSGSYSGEDHTHSVVMNNPIIEKVEWTLQHFLSTDVNPDTGGDIIPAPPGKWYTANTEAEITAEPANSYQFLFWTGDILGTENPTTKIITEPINVTAQFSPLIEVTIQTQPDGLSFTADGKNYTAPYTFTWAQNSTHIIAADSLYSADTGVRYQYNTWSDKGTREHTITVAENNTTITAHYNTQYYLTIDSDYGNPQGERWYNKDTKVVFSVDEIDKQGFTKKTFNKWTGDFEGYSNSDSVILSRPKTITAVWDTEYFIELLSEYGTTSGQGWYPEGTEVTFSVSPIIQTIGDTVKHIFIQWNGTGEGSYTGTNSTSTVILNNPMIEKAEWNTKYFLSTSVEPKNSGTVVPRTPGEWFNENSTVEMSATPKNEYLFSHWAGDIEHDVNPASIIMDNPKNIKAVFGLINGITINTNPTGLEFIADNAKYTAPHTFMWTAQSTHTITAVSPQDPDSSHHYEFTSWSNGNPQEHTYTVPDQKDTLIAYFQPYYYLSVHSTYGTPEGSGWYEKESTAQVSINNYIDSDPDDQTRKSFYQWKGDYSGTDTLASIIMNKPKTITASWKDQYYVDVISPWGTTYGQGWYTENTSATISVGTPVNIDSTKRYAFSKWVGIGENSYSGNSLTPSIIVKNPIIETAVWDKEYYIHTSVNPEWGGTVRFSPPGNWHKENSCATVIAVPDTANNYIFASWSGDLISNKNPDSLYVDNPKEITANFNTAERTLITTEPSGLPITVDGVKYISPEYFNWPYGTTHSISVPGKYKPNNDVQYLFQHWTDQGDTLRTISVGERNRYKAVFNVQYFLHTQINPSDGGTVSPSEPGSWFDKGIQVTLNADPADGYTFMYWSGSINTPNNPVKITMDQSKSAIAHFHKSTDISENPDLPDTFMLGQNYPNPFNPETTIEYQIPVSGHIKLEICNTKGQTIRILVDSYQNAGTYQTIWNGRDNLGHMVSSGIYYYVLRNKTHIKIKKLLFIK